MRSLQLFQNVCKNFRLFSPLTAVPFEIEIFPWNMLNPPISNFPLYRDFFFGPPVRPTGSETWCSKPLRAISSLFFTFHRRTLWDRYSSLKFVKFSYIKIPPLQGSFFRTTRSAYRSRILVLKSPPKGFPKGSEFERPRIKKVVKTKMESFDSVEIFKISC